MRFNRLIGQGLPRRGGDPIGVHHRRSPKGIERTMEVVVLRSKNAFSRQPHFDSRLELLDAQRTDDAAQQDLVTLRLAEATNRVTLYKVLGGGADALAGSGGTWATEE